MAALIRALERRSRHQAAAAAASSAGRSRSCAVSCWSRGRWCRAAAPRRSARSRATSDAATRSRAPRGRRRPKRAALREPRVRGVRRAATRTTGEALWRQTRALLPAIDVGVRSGRAASRDRVHARPVARARSGAAGRRPLRAPAVRRGLSPGQQGGGAARSGWPRSIATAAGARRWPRPGTLRAAHDAGRRAGRARALRARSGRPAGGTRSRSARSTARVDHDARRRARTGWCSTGPGWRTSSTRSRSSAARQVAVDLAAAAARRRFPTGSSTSRRASSGSATRDEQLRTQFLDTVPIHRRRTGAYLIAQHETTYAEWIAFLNALPPAERARNAARRLDARMRGSLRAARDGRRLAADVPADAPKRYSARAGEPIVYVGRQATRAPGLAALPGRGHLARPTRSATCAWLRDTGRVPGARLCTELEWERAARGADDRLFPHGDELDRGRRQLRPDLRARRLRVRAGRRSDRTPPRAARSASTIWRATCSSSSTSSREGGRAGDPRRRLLLQASQLPEHEPRAGPVELSRRDHGNPCLRSHQEEMNDVTAKQDASRVLVRSCGCILLLAAPGRARSRGMHGAGDARRRGCTAQGMHGAGDARRRGCTAQGMHGAGDARRRGCTAQGMHGAGDDGAGDARRRGCTAQGMHGAGRRADGHRPASPPELKGVEIELVEMRGHDVDERGRVARAHQHPGHERRPGQLHHASAAARPSGTTRSRTSSTRPGSPAEDLDLFIAGRAEGSDAEPVPPRRGAGQPGRALRRLLLPQVERAVDVALPLQRRRPAARRRWRSRRMPSRPEQVHLRVHGDRRRVEVRAQLGLPAVGETQAWEYDATANGGWALALQTFQLEDYYDVCKTAAQAAYCQDGRSYTKNGTLVDLFDTRQIIWPNCDREPVQRVEPRLAVDDGAGVLHRRRDRARASRRCKDSALQRTRYRELSPVGRVRQLRVHRSPRARPHRGRPLGEPAHQHAPHPGVLADLLHAQRIRSRATRCPGTAARARPRSARRCRSAAARAPTPGWTAACIAQATRVCQTGGVQWPKGEVVAAAICPQRRPARFCPKYLLGPDGRRAARRRHQRHRARRRRSPAGRAIRSGRARRSACAIYGGAPRDELGSALLGEVRADQALAAPLAREVSARLRRSRRARYARHGFSFTLPADHSGQRVRLRDRRGDRRRAGGAADADPQRHRPRPALRAQRARGGRGARRRAAAPARPASAATDARRPAARRRGRTRAPAAADACAPADSSAPVNSRVVHRGHHGLDRGARPTAATRSIRRSSRAGCSSTAPRCSTGSRRRRGRRRGAITLPAGQRYHLRWDRFQAEPPSGSRGRG